ncbi:hypothetical protein [Shewanella baltica]|uniref:hypothetical protein n=1 Tax=Shewanella baltica TaxID=62322 RepID=UPI00217D5619|nr:hypothetical protein [Shewanella baltica]MCS6175861.1 hypothetical protein [Shewanella baltica]
MTTPSASPQAEQQTQTHKSETSFWWLIILLAVIAAFLLTLYFMNFNGGWGNQGDFGAFGDFLGGVLNPILGFATVGLLIWSLKMQMKELSLSNQQLALTRQELKETKEETALSRKAMEDQVKHLQKEAKLNELLRLMATMKTKCDNMLNSKVNEDDIIIEGVNLHRGVYRNYCNSLNDMTYAYVLNVFMPSIDNDKLNQLAEEFRLQYEAPNSSWQELEALLCLYTQLALSYYDINNSTEFAAVYLKEAMNMLGPFNEIFQTDETTKLLDKVQSASNDARSIMLYDSLCSDNVTHSD